MAPRSRFLWGCLLFSMCFGTRSAFSIYPSRNLGGCQCPTFLAALKVPKREIFLTELIILSYPIWTGDLGTKAKNRFV
jgi:hypothetical protein